MDLLLHTGSMVVHNPESNMGNAVGCPPAVHMVHKGIRVGLGTDGYTSDMLESFKAATTLHKHHLCDPSAAWAEVPTMLFQNNPRITEAFFDKPIGVIKPGACADVIVTDYLPYTPMNSGNVNAHLLFGMNGRSVTTTIINGNVCMRDRELVNIDKDAVLAHCREQAQDFGRRFN